MHWVRGFGNVSVIVARSCAKSCWRCRGWLHPWTELKCPIDHAGFWSRPVQHGSVAAWKGSGCRKRVVVSAGPHGQIPQPTDRSPASQLDSPGIWSSTQLMHVAGGNAQAEIWSATVDWRLRSSSRRRRTKTLKKIQETGALA